MTNLLSPQTNIPVPLMSKPLATKVSTPISENVQIVPKVSPLFSSTAFLLGLLLCWNTALRPRDHALLQYVTVYV